MKSRTNDRVPTLPFFCIACAMFVLLTWLITSFFGWESSFLIIATTALLLGTSNGTYVMHRDKVAEKQGMLFVSIPVCIFLGCVTTAFYRGDNSWFLNSLWMILIYLSAAGIGYYVVGRRVGYVWEEARIIMINLLLLGLYAEVAYELCIHPWYIGLSVLGLLGAILSFAIAYYYGYTHTTNLAAWRHNAIVPVITRWVVLVIFVTQCIYIVAFGTALMFIFAVISAVLYCAIACFFYRLGNHHLLFIVC